MIISRVYLGFFDWGGCYIAESLRDEDCFSKALDVHLVTHIFSRQNDKKLYDSLLYIDDDFDDSQLPRTIKSLIDPCLLLVRRFKDTCERFLLVFVS